MKISGKYIAFCFLLLFLMCFVFAKDYQITNANLYYNIQKDGTVEVQEYINYNFIGSFSYAYRDFEKGQWEINNIQVFDATTNNFVELDFYETTSYSSRRITWNYSATNEKKTFLIKYTLTKAINVYADVGDFYWKVWGSGWEKPVGKIYGEMILTGTNYDAKEIYSWGYPELNGKIGWLNDQRLIFEAHNIPAKQWMEIRVVFPSNYFSSTTNAIVLPGSGLERIENEASFQKTLGVIDSISLILIAFLILITIIVSIKTQDSPFIPRLAMAIGYPFLVLCFLLGFFIGAIRDAPIFSAGVLLLLLIVELIFFVYTWSKHGKEPKVEYNAIYEREAPYNYSPAVVRLLTMTHFFKEPSLNEISAEILDLCLKGKLKLEKKGKEFLIHIVDRKTDDLPMSERKVMNLIIRAAKFEYVSWWDKHLKGKKPEETPDTASIKDIANYLKHHQSEARVWLMGWKASVKLQYAMERFDSKKTGTNFFLAGNFIYFVALFFFATQYIIPLLLFTFFVVGLYPMALPNRTEKGTLHYKKWINFKKFLHDFSQLKQVPPTAIALWEQYLVYAIPLDEAKNVEKAMNIAFENYHGEIRSTMFVGGVHGFNARDFSGLSSGFSSAFSSAASTSGGGGFGGGGGGAG